MYDHLTATSAAPIPCSCKTAPAWSTPAFPDPQAAAAPDWPDGDGKYTSADLPLVGFIDPTTCDSTEDPKVGQVTGVADWILTSWSIYALQVFQRLTEPASLIQGDKLSALANQPSPGNVSSARAQQGHSRMTMGRT